MSNKKIINLLFNGNRDEVLYFYEKLDEYKKALDKYKEMPKKTQMDGVWAKDELNIAKFRLNEAFNTLIEK